MKKILFSIICLFVSSFEVFAQEVEENNTLFNNFNFSKVGFAIAPSYQISSFDQSTGHIFALRGGVVFSDQITVGGYMQSSVNEISPASETDNSLYMDYRVFGGLLEYTLWSNKLVHFTFPVLIGGGEVQMDLRGDDYLRPGYSDEEAYFFHFEPSVLAEINLLNNVRLNAGVGYRYMSSNTFRNFNTSDLTGFTGNIGLKFILLSKGK